MPDNLKTGVENLSGIDMSDVRVHYNSSKPAEVGALAYTQGTNIHLAQGQERHLPHEAWHVVQQKQGRVQSTLKMKGRVNINDDPALEKEADIMGAQVIHNNGFKNNDFVNHILATPTIPLIQRVHVHLSGTGVKASDQSLGKKFDEKYKERLTAKKNRSRRKSKVFDGPTELYGAWQTFSKMQERVLNAVKFIGEAWINNDHEILITGFSRGAGNAIEVARFINIYGLLNNKMELIPSTKGAKIKYLGLLDPVPATPNPGKATMLTVVDTVSTHKEKDDFKDPSKTEESYQRLEGKVVPYEELEIPSNVMYVKSILAHAEARGMFEAYRIKTESKRDTKAATDVIPFSLHSQVGGTWFGFTGSPAAQLALDALISGALEAGVKFRNAKKFSPQKREELVKSLFSTKRPEEGWLIRLMIRLNPNLRHFKSSEVGEIGKIFLDKLENMRLEDKVKYFPILSQFELKRKNLNPPELLIDNSQKKPDEYFRDVTDVSKILTKEGFVEQNELKKESDE